MTLTDLSRALFPFRTKLLEDIDYLRAQLSQKQRRIDELQEALIAIAKPAPLAPRSSPLPVAPLNRGWESFKRKAAEQDADKQPAPAPTATAVTNQSA